MTPSDHAQLLRELADCVYTGYSTKDSRLRNRARAAAAEIEGQQQVETSLAEEMWDLIETSDGVAGFHLNGDLAPWEDLVPGGRFEQLPSLARFGGGEGQSC